jgi:hypothetical protein
MNHEAEEENAFSENDLFDFDPDQIAIDNEEADNDYSEFDSDPTPGEEEEEEEQTETSEEEEEEEEEGLVFKDAEETKKDDEEDFDLKSFNEKLGKDFKSTKELKDFLDGKENTPSKEEEDTEQVEYEKAQSTIEVYDPILKSSDEDLMRKEYEAVAMNAGKDLSDLDVQEEIEDKIQEMVENGTLDLRARQLREDITKSVLAPAINKKKEIETQRTEREAAAQAAEKQNLQDALAEIFNSESFYGLKPDKETVAKVYQKINNGEFQKTLQDKKTVAELAMLHEYKEEIYKKASGLTYSDGLKSVLDDFKGKKEEKGSTAITRAQRKGSSGGSDATQGLIASMLYEKPKTKAK